jgi:propionate CoA-transferase
MNWLTKLRLLVHILTWRFTWSRHKLDYKPSKTRSPKFVSAWDAAGKMADGACVFSNGFAGNARCSIFFYAIRDRFIRTGHPKGLTWINNGAQGSRGKVPGTVEELGIPGLMKRYLAGHLETCKAQLRLAERGELELHTLPQGAISLLLEAQTKGEQHLRSKTGVGSFLDPRTGTGSVIHPPGAASFVEADGDALIYTMPQPDVALFNAPYADAEGNIYFKHAATLTENRFSAAAARQKGGLVMAAVSGIIPRSDAEISMPASEVDYIVVNPYNEQTVSVPQHRYWPMFTPACTLDTRAAVQRLKFINTFLKITPVRDEIGQRMARLAADTFVKEVPKGSMINIGVGFPEEAVRVLIERGLEQTYTFTTEAGSYGGLPAPGIFFGAAIHPQHLESSQDMFHRYQTELEAAMFGFLHVDRQGNVNVSKRGPRLTDYVGPGGLPDIAEGARTLIFVGNWMHGAEYRLEGETIRLIKPGKPKFVDQVPEVTFNGQVGLAAGKKIFYVTEVGLFQLTPEGLTLRVVSPGIEVERDIFPYFRPGGVGAFRRLGV